MKTHVLITIFIIVAMSCKSKKSTENTEKMVKENPVLISKGNLYGSGEEGIEKQNLVITNDDDWNELKKQMNSINNVSNGFLETEIDFSKYSIIAVFDDVKTSGGHSIELNMTTTSEHTIIKVISKSPEGLATSVMAQPYYIAKLEKTDLPIVFQ
ncbi:protease complex subunit PrcB family protein [Winogradskyella forsetii]|uniref:protease complex subunit PrcB family protein n=1 Tax=Winogradskyella forsetii TaxID=2686077 RepID=UPI0015BFD820|nr:protease complex subunit PrcB family protein [Winogradskyella forsetii]